MCRVVAPEFADEVFAKGFVERFHSAFDYREQLLHRIGLLAYDILVERIEKVPFAFIGGVVEKLEDGRFSVH